jgi:hypothetical protein
MSTPAINDPWASTDHDPLDAPQPSAATPALSTAHALLLARADITDAVAHTGEARHAYANSSARFAAAVLAARDATDTQRELATYYLADAEILTHL